MAFFRFLTTDSEGDVVSEELLFAARTKAERMRIYRTSVA